MTKQTTITTNSAAERIEYFTLAELYLSNLNPRQDVAEEGIALLAESLVTCGLIQNLAGLRDENGKVGIVAGGRRLRALNIAVKARPDLGVVPVRMAASAHVAEEWANAENTAREELDPVDEVRAYGKMAGKALSVAKISHAFGVTEAHVRRRLALAGLPALVLDALKTGEISMGIAKAMTVGDDEKKILEVLNRATSGGWFNEYQVKAMLKPDAVDGDDCRALFVGVEAYQAGGGTLSQDLFENEVLFNNPDILERLFAEKLEDAATALKEAEGWTWVMTSEDSNPYWYELQRDHGFARLYKEEGVLSEEQSERYDELADLANGETLDKDGHSELAALEAILEGEYSGAQKMLAGAMIYVSRSGEVEAVRGLIKAEDQAEAIAAGLMEASKHESADATLPKPTFSQKFVTDMMAIRLAAVQTALLDKPDYLLSLFAFAVSPASGYYNDIFAFGYGGQERNTPEIDDQFTLDPRLGGERDEDAEDAYAVFQEMAKQGMAGAFKAFRKAGKKTRNGSITEFLARAFKTQSPEFMAEIETEIGTDIRAIWTPTAANCFKRLKGHQLDALYMALLDLNLDNAASKAFAKSKKGEKNEAMHKLFNVPEHQKICGVTADQKARIDAWVPESF